MCMDDYLKHNNDYWQKGYNADNVESCVFRVYGRILKEELLSPPPPRGDLVFGQSPPLRMVDFGCGQGAACAYFKSMNFDVYGVDISLPDLEVCKRRMPDIASHFTAIDSKPDINDFWFNGDYHLVTAIQSLYYYSDDDLHTRLMSIYNQMVDGGIIYATMMGTKCYYYDHSEDAGNGLRKVVFKTKRLSVDNYYVNFIDSEESLMKKFSMFNKMHIGYYDACYREDEGSDFHWTFVGRK